MRGAEGSAARGRLADTQTIVPFSDYRYGLRTNWSKGTTTRDPDRPSWRPASPAEIVVARLYRQWHMTYSQHEKTRAAAWKTSTTTLPEAAKAPAQYVSTSGTAGGPAYEFCLPREFAALSLLPEVREPALTLFAELQIPWHAGVDGG